MTSTWGKALPCLKALGKPAWDAREWPPRMGLVFDLGSWLTRQSYATPDSSALQPDPVRAGGSQPCHSLTSISVTATLFGQHTDTLASTFYLILSKVTMGGIVSSSAYWHHTIFSDHESYASKRWECIQNRQYRINHAFRLKKKKSYTWVFFSCKYRQMENMISDTIMVL